MGRTAKPWRRIDRGKDRGWWAVVRGHQRYLGPSLKAAKLKLKALVAANAPTHHSDYSVRQLVDLFLTELRDRVASKEISPYTLANLKSTLNRWAEACRRIKPEDLRPLHLKAWLKAHPEWNQSSKSTAVRRVKSWSAWAVRDGYLEVNRLRDAITGDQLKREAADPADLAKIEAAIDRDCFRDFFRVLFDTGCRPGELKTLTAATVDWGLSTAIVRGKSGERAIGLTPRALEILRRCSLARPEGALLRTVTGVDWSPRAIHRQWKRACKRAGVEGVVCYHLRHALYVRWHDAGISDIVISAQLGHYSHSRPHIGLLRSTYGHAEARHLAEAAQLASSPIASSKRRPIHSAH